MIIEALLEVALVGIVTLSPVIVALLTRPAHAKRVERAFNRRKF